MAENKARCYYNYYSKLSNMYDVNLYCDMYDINMAFNDTITIEQFNKTIKTVDGLVVQMEVLDKFYLQYKGSDRYL